MVFENMKVLLIDPSDIPYSLALSDSLKEYCDLTTITRYSSLNQNALKYFYKYSDAINNKRFRLVVRGLEYAYAWLKIINLVNHNDFDLIHIQWSNIFKFDCLVYKILKKKTKKLVFTAHDVIPHDGNQTKIEQNHKLYNLFDKIVVHGEYAKGVLAEYYPEFIDKVYVQKHGMLENIKFDVNKETIEKHPQLLNLENKIVFGSLGQIGEYKGIDLLIEGFKKANIENTFLLIAGKNIGNYKINNELNKNIYFYNQRFSNEEESYFYSLIDVTATTYRSSSMSGVIFTSASYHKTLLTTTVESLGDVVKPVVNYCFICEPNVDSIAHAIKEVALSSKKELETKGDLFYEHVKKEYNWLDISKALVNECYKED